MDNSFFDSLEALARSVHPESFIVPAVLVQRVAALRAAFDADSREVAAVQEILAGAEDSAYGPAIADIFDRWEHDGGPSIVALAAHALDIFGIAADTARGRALLIAAALAEYPNDMPYHGNDHYRKVVVHTIRLIATHNGLYEGTPSFIAPDAAALLLTAACIHDLGHEGRDNQQGEVYTPGLIEQESCRIAEPYLTAAGLADDSRKTIEAMVFCTDITYAAGSNSPCMRMKTLFKHFFWDSEAEDVSLMMMGRLRVFEDDPQLIHMAMMLHEADIATSAGLSYAQTLKETRSIMEERGQPGGGPAMIIAFLREQLGETLYTEAAKKLFRPQMDRILAQAEEMSKI